MSKVAHYLQEHLLGEVTTGLDVRKHFSQDASVLQIMPSVVVFPRNENDIRKTARFTWQLAERGRSIAMTARGAGSDVTGAALGNGIIMAFTAHMNKILALDPKKELVEVEPGISFDKLQQTLHTHGFFVPPYPSSLQYSTVGGAVANNASGEKSVKYGDMSAYTKRLRVVLANGEVIETRRLGKREVSKKMGQAGFEGEIYRALDALLEEKGDLLKAVSHHIRAASNSAGYNIFDIKQKDGSFDLTPLFVGAQGTLGIISEATLKIEPHNPLSSLVLLSFSDLGQVANALPKILELKPAAVDMVNRQALEQVSAINPNQLLGALENPSAAMTLFVEFDDIKDAAQKKSVKKLTKLAEKLGVLYQTAGNLDAQQKLLKVRQSVATLMHNQVGAARSVPIAEDIGVAPNMLVTFLERAAHVYESQGLSAAAWGRAGDGVVHMQPMLDLAQLGDRQKLFRISDEIYKIALELGGTISASHNDGRMRAPYLMAQFGGDVIEVFEKVKAIFDPYGTLNPGVKVGGDLQQLKDLMRNEYSLSHRLEHLPRS